MSELNVPADWWVLVWPCLLVLGVIVLWEVGRRTMNRRRQGTQNGASPPVKVERRRVVRGVRRS